MDWWAAERSLRQQDESAACREALHGKPPSSIEERCDRPSWLAGITC